MFITSFIWFIFLELFRNLELGVEAKWEPRKDAEKKSRKKKRVVDLLMLFNR